MQFLSVLCFSILGFALGSSLNVVSQSESPVNSVSLSSTSDDEISVPTYEGIMKTHSENMYAVKHIFINLIGDEKIDEAEQLVSKYPYLVQGFNRDIFKELLLSFDYYGYDKATFWRFFDLIKSSFLDVSHSNTTPLILSINCEHTEIFTAVLDVPGIEAIVNAVDEFGRTALMYACKQGNEYTILRLIRLSVDSIDKKDDYQKTALHYVCEMTGNQMDSEFIDSKLSFANLLLANGATVYRGVPEYSLSSYDGKLANLIEQKSGEVITSFPLGHSAATLTLTVLANVFIRFFGLTSATARVESALIGFIFNNPLMLGLNEIFFSIQKMIMPQYDFNLVVSIDSGDAIRDVSLNLLFVVFIGFMIKSLLTDGSKIRQLF